MTYRNIYPLCLLVLGSLTACRQDPPAQTPPAALAGPAKQPLQPGGAGAPADTGSGPELRRDVQEYVDSMMTLEVTLPPILDEKAYDTATVDGFKRLASLTRGELKLLASASLLEENITSILCKNSTDYADVLFLVDNTGSMDDDIAAVKAGMNQILDVLHEKKNIRLAIATYKDRQEDSMNWFHFQNFETNYAAAKSFMDSIRTGNGGDIPESVYEAFIAAADHKFWRSANKRIVLIIGDARGKSKEEGGMYTMEDMLKKAGESRIKVNFFPLIVTPYAEQYRARDKDPQPATATPILTQVWPNPTDGMIHMKMAHPGRYRITVYTMTGVLVEDQHVDSDEWLVDMRIHNDGLYVIRITDRNNQFDVAKFILKR